MAYTKEGTDGQILRSSKWIVTVIMIHFVIFDVMLGRHICLTWSSSWPFESHFFAKDKCHANT